MSPKTTEIMVKLDPAQMTEINRRIDEAKAQVEVLIARNKRLIDATNAFLRQHGPRMFPTEATPENCEALRVYRDLLAVLGDDAPKWAR